VDIVTIGQYLQPSKKHFGWNLLHRSNLPFMKIWTRTRFRHVESGPLVRSSYKAQNIFYKKCLFGQPINQLTKK
jgi:lipoic acid synthetase